MNPIRWLLNALDLSLSKTAVWLGLAHKSATQRYSLLFLYYSAIYSFALLRLSVVPLVALGLGYFAILAVGRAWVANEKQRTRIAKKIIDGDPDDLPDLRLIALLSALQLLILFPLLFQQVQWHFHWYSVSDEATLWTWFAFSLQSFNQAFLSVLETYGIRIEEVGFSSTWGRHLVLLQRLTINLLLIQGIIRLFVIQETIQDAIRALDNDPDIAVRVGQRAVPALLQQLDHPLPKITANAINALARIKDSRAIEPLVAIYAVHPGLCGGFYVFRGGLLFFRGI